MQDVHYFLSVVKIHSCKKEKGERHWTRAKLQTQVSPLTGYDLAVCCCFSSYVHDYLHIQWPLLFSQLHASFRVTVPLTLNGCSLCSAVSMCVVQQEWGVKPSRSRVTLCTGSKSRECWAWLNCVTAKQRRTWPTWWKPETSSSSHHSKFTTSRCHSRNSNNEILIKRQPLICTRARHAVQENKIISFRLGQYKKKN